MKIKILPKANDNKALDDLQDKSFLSKADRLILKRGGLDHYNYLSYDEKLDAVKAISAINSGKKKLQMRIVLDELRDYSENKADEYEKIILNELLKLPLRCFWVEVSKGPGVYSRYDNGCTRNFELGLEEFESHHAYIDKEPNDIPYDIEKGLYKKISGKSNMIYMYYSEADLVSDIITKVKEMTSNPEETYLGMMTLKEIADFKK